MTMKRYSRPKYKALWLDLQRRVTELEYATRSFEDFRIDMEVSTVAYVAMEFKKNTGLKIYGSMDRRNWITLADRENLF